jgi:hypothetical protein
MKKKSKFSLKNITLSIETSRETVTCSLPASKVSVILDQIKENIKQSFIELDDENREILSQMKAIGQNDYPINLYLDFPIHVDQANNLIQDIKDKVEQEKYEEIQENIEILLTEKSIPTEKQIELLENMIFNLKMKPIVHYEVKDNNVNVRR